VARRRRKEDSSTATGTTRITEEADGTVETVVSSKIKRRGKAIDSRRHAHLLLT
jgi:hypothetical protein